MGSNRITAKEAREASGGSSLDAIGKALIGINNAIKSSMEKKETSANVGFLKERMDSQDCDFIILDLQDRGFKVKTSINEATYNLEIFW